MNLIYSLILGIVQGLTEFLPISSSGHLVLLQNFFGEINVGFDVMIHFASLLAILIFFFKDILDIAKDILTWNTKGENFRLALYVVIASIPIAFIGFFFRYFIYDFFSNLYMVSLGFFISAMFLFTASFSTRKSKLKAGNSFIIGIAQALALVPGISRSGATISTGVLFGIDRKKAIRFSFLLVIPAIIGANLLKISDIVNLNFSVFSVGFSASFFSSLFAIFLFFKYIKIKNFRYLAYYCFLLAILTLLSQVL